MKKKIDNTHFTLETRTIIENSLNEKKSITEISKILRRDRSNIGREIMKHRVMVFPSSFNNSHQCNFYNKCNVKGYECYKYCKKIEVNLCEKLTSAPHVCNGCESKKGCRHVKFYYKAIEANSEYQNNWHTDRTGLHYTQEEMDVLNTDFKGLVLKNKSVYHSLVIINSRGFNFKIRTIYKQIEKKQLDIKPSDLPRKRKEKKEQVDKNYKRGNIDGHTYDDFMNYKANNPKDNEMQMDTVEGIKENNTPVILTLQIVEIKFLFMFKIDSQTNDKVIEKLIYLRNILSEKLFNKIMKILLTDNGKEFINLDAFIDNFNGINIFYCHPYASFEKSNIENNHELIRRVIPKGVSLKCYTQEDLDLLCSNINSLYRKELDGKCPFDLVNKYIPITILSKLNLRHIKAEEVMLIPELLGLKNVNNIKKYLDKKEISDANIKFLEQ